MENLIDDETGNITESKGLEPVMLAEETQVKVTFGLYKGCVGSAFLVTRTGAVVESEPWGNQEMFPQEWLEVMDKPWCMQVGDCLNLQVSDIVEIMEGPNGLQNAFGCISHVGLFTCMVDSDSPGSQEWHGLKQALRRHNIVLP